MSLFREDHLWFLALLVIIWKAFKALQMLNLEHQTSLTKTMLHAQQVNGGLLEHDARQVNHKVKYS